MSTQHKVILITGSAKRLGRDIALSLAGDGISLALHYHHSEQAAHSLLNELQKKNITATLFKSDLTKIPEIESMVDQIIKKFGRIDVLINNAAVFYDTPFGSIAEKDWDMFLNTNLKGPFFLIQTIVKKLNKESASPARHASLLSLQGMQTPFSKIINIADSGGPKTRANYLPYWISKSGVISMTETLANIFGDTIQVNTVAPGPIGFPEDMDRLKNDIVVDPKEIVKTVLHLVNDTTSITGNTIIIDRGRRYR